MEVPATASSCASHATASACSSAVGLRDSTTRQSDCMRKESQEESPISQSTRAATRRAASMMSGPLSTASDCCGTIVRDRTCTAMSGLALSNTRSIPGTSCRSIRLYKDRFARLVVVSGSMPGPPRCDGSSVPAATSRLSRHASQSSRRRLARVKSRLSGSALACSACMALD